ncbi:MAG: galactose mutarotase [Clostridiales bacterium]|nr:galactose mutarotase [Clostridiales bacterium]
MSVTKSLFGTNSKGQDINAFLIENNNHMKIQCITLGATLQKIELKDKDEKDIDILLGFDDVKGFEERHDFQGVTVGPVANRISDGLTIDGKKVPVTKTHGDVTLHSNGDFSSAVWDAIITDTDSVEFTYIHPDGKDGFPGNIKTTVRYTLTDDNEIKISYDAVSDKKTALNITNHSYFNLKGFDGGSILDHTLYVNADAFTPMTDDLIPSGEIRPVDDTPFDFRTAKEIGRDIEDDYDQLKAGNGYDHNFAINNYDGKLRLAATAVAPNGVKLDCFTDLPGMQLYVGNFLSGAEGKSGKPMDFRTGFCLETQYFPNASNTPEFKNYVFDAGEHFISTTVYRISLV